MVEVPCVISLTISKYDVPFKLSSTVAHVCEAFLYVSQGWWRHPGSWLNVPRVLAVISASRPKADSCDAWEVAMILAKSCKVGS